MFNIKKISIISTVKRIIDIAIFVYMIIACVLFVTGGFSYKFLGIRISAHSPGQIFIILIILVIIRICVAIEKKNALMMLISIILSLLITEAALRISDLPIGKEPKLRQWRRPSETLGWELIPFLKGKGDLGADITINSHGLRDVERSWTKADGEYRILALGDSFTYGYALDLEETYVKQLELILKSDKKNIDVINGGVIGYNLYQSLMYLKQSGIKYEPDLVIYFFWLDDVGGPNSPEEIKETYNKLLHSDEFKQEKQKNTTKSYLVNMLKNSQILIDTRLRPFTSADWLKSIEDRKKSFGVLNQRYLSGKHDLKPFQKNLYELKNMTRQINADLLVVLIPDAVQINDHSMQKMNQILHDMCVANSISFLDITNAFEKESDVSSLYLFPLDAHTSAKGDKIIAREVYEKICNELFSRVKGLRVKGQGLKVKG